MRRDEAAADHPDDLVADAAHVVSAASSRHSPARIDASSCRMRRESASSIARA